MEVHDNSHACRVIVIQADISLNVKHFLWLHNRCCGHKFDYSEACTDGKGVRTQLVSLQFVLVSKPSIFDT